MADMMNREVLFLAVDGFDSSAFLPLWQCFGNLNASLRIASFNADDDINSQDGSLSTHSDMSFNQASLQNFDVVVIPDAKTADAVANDSDAITLLKETNNNNAAIVCVGNACSALISADIVSGRSIAAPEDLRSRLEDAGAQLSSDPIVVSENIFSAQSNADMQSLCNMVSDYITTLRGAIGEAAA